MGRNLLRQFSNWRHSRGFGVHSPLAFELLSRVLPDRPPYYADSTINSTFRERRRQRIARIILRLVSHFEPSTVFTNDYDFQKVAMLANSQCRFILFEPDAQMSITTQQNYTKIRIGKPDSTRKSITLSNERDLDIIVYRDGLSETYVNTTL